MRREAPSIAKLRPDRYLLATSRSLSPANKATLAEIIGPALNSEGDIFSAGDLKGLLRAYPDIHRAHIKLWLSSTGVLERIVQARHYGFAELSEAEIRSKLALYVENASFPAARAHLEANHVLIVSGAPGVGKTTLAQMLAWAYAADGWELTPIDSVDAGLGAPPSQRRVFLFDDFLGEIGLEAPAHADSKLARFIRHVVRNEGCRFILTTRSYVLEAARKRSEALSDPALDLLRYVLDVGVYTRRVRARILYNHLRESGVPAAHIEALVEDGRLPTIIDHPNYSPRIIEWMTEPLHLRGVSAEAYTDAFLAMLRNPKRMWETAYREHIAPHCRHLLIARYLYGQRLTDVAALRAAFDRLHPELCRTYGLAHGPNDFENALSTLEGGFLVIHDGEVSFINPSVRDFLQSELRNRTLLAVCAGVPVSASWAANVWQLASLGSLGSGELTDVARALVASVHLFLNRSTRIYRSGQFHSVDLDLGRRLALLVELWSRTGDTAFADAILALATKPPVAFSYNDKDELLDLIVQIRSGDLPDFPFLQVADQLERKLAGVFLTVATDELSGIAEALNESAPFFTDVARRALVNAIEQEFDSLQDVLRDIGDDIDLLEQHKDLLNELAPHAGVSERTLTSALEAIEERQVALDGRQVRRPAPVPDAKADAETFGDSDMKSLFSSLIR